MPDTASAPVRRKRLSPLEQRGLHEAAIKKIDQRILFRTKSDLEELQRSCEVIATSSSGKPWAAQVAAAANALRQAAASIKLES